MKFLVSVLTPFDTQGRVDHGALRAHVLWLMAKGVEGFVITSTAGEFFYLTEREKEAVQRTILDTVQGRPVFTCTWDPSPKTTVYLSDAAREQGAAGILLPPPLYYTLDDATVETWYRGLHERVALPLLAYHNPRYIPTGIGTHLYEKLHAEKVLLGIQDNSGDSFRIERLTEIDRWGVYAGGDRVMAEASQIPGLSGFVSEMGNVWPEFCMRIFKGEGDDLEEALRDRVAKVKRAGGIRGLKGALKMGCRMPILPSNPEAIDQLPPRER